MQGRTRKAAAAGAAAFVLAGSAVLAAPATASADTITAKCGDTVTAKPGDVVNTPFGPQTITDGLTSLVGGLLGGLCKITVNVVDTVVAPVPGVAPVAGAVGNAVAGTTNAANGAAQQAGSALSGGKPSQQQPPSSGGSPQTGPNGGNAPANQGSAGPIPASNSPVLGGDASTFTLLPFGSAAGYAPMRDYSGIPYALAGLWSPAPGLRYGGQIPGYGPAVGSLGQNGGGDAVQNAGQAQSLTGGGTGAPSPVSLPMLIAVLSLSGVSAALVRRWVLRGAPVLDSGA